VRELVDRVLELARALADKAEIPEVEVFEHDFDWIYSRLREAGVPTGNIWRLDNKYYTTTLDGFVKIAQWEKVNLRRYMAEYFDCDDYSWIFRANVVKTFLINAVAWVIDYTNPECAHAYNIVVAEDGVRVYEPQTDEFMTVEDARKWCQYGLRDIVLVV